VFSKNKFVNHCVSSLQDWDLVRCWDCFETEVEDANQLQLGFKADGDISAGATKALMLLDLIKAPCYNPHVTSGRFDFQHKFPKSDGNYI